MDRETTPSYKLIAQATDGGGLFCRSDISLKMLDVNDNAPAFSSPHYLASVYENTAPKSLLTRLQASDPDEGKPACCSVPLPQIDDECRERQQRAVFQSLLINVSLSTGLNRTLVYTLVDSSDELFSIEPVSGMVILEKSLDRESQDSYRLRVQATDQAGQRGALFSQVGNRFRTPVALQCDH